MTNQENVLNALFLPGRMRGRMGTLCNPQAGKTASPSSNPTFRSSIASVWALKPIVTLLVQHGDLLCEVCRERMIPVGVIFALK